MSRTTNKSRPALISPKTGKPYRQQSPLQQAWTRVSFIVYWQIQNLHTGHLERAMPLSKETQRYIREREANAIYLRRALLADYRAYKSKLLREKK